MSLLNSITAFIISKLRVEDVDYTLKPVLDEVPVEGSKRGMESGGMHTALSTFQAELNQDKSDVPLQGSEKYFTAGGAYSDKGSGCVQGSTKNVTSDTARKYMQWLINTLGMGFSVSIPESL
jgi:hypothetical protein